MNRILVITNGESDLLRLLEAHCTVTVITTDSTKFDADEFDSLCVLMGNESAPAVLSAPLHLRLNEMRKQGKPVFCEFLASIAETRTRGTPDIDRQRMAFYRSLPYCDTLSNGDLLDGQSNKCIKYAPLAQGAYPILTYQGHVCAHSRMEIDEETHKKGLWALWWMDGTTMVSSIRICNFHRARFAPFDKWQAIITSIISFLAGERITPTFDEQVCTFHRGTVKSASDTEDAVRRGINWVTNAGMLKNGGECGVHEGFFNRISAQNGAHIKNLNVRTDCTCEIGGALFMDHLITGNEYSEKVARAVFDFAFEWMQVKDGEHKGMLRWSELAFETCYQDDAARAIIPLLLCQYFDVDVPHFDEIVAALDYMVETTGEDGIRVPCTEMYISTPEQTAWLKTSGSAEPCAHFNSYYHGALLLAYRICKKPEYLEYAERGLSTLMAHYPNTRRETSETEEGCRLVFPLAALYGVTGKPKHYEWLVRVVDDLEKRRYPSGGYAEWDTDYKAFCSRNHNGECALLANNGDPVADLLYSNNWLPLGFSYAYLVTGEKRFYDLWCSIASFMLSAQMYSNDKLLDGAWARAFDLDRGENYGLPHDIGWGPYCIESGWTVGEILIGLQFMHAAEKRNGK